MPLPMNDDTVSSLEMRKFAVPESVSCTGVIEPAGQYAINYNAVNTGSATIEDLRGYYDRTF